MISHDSVERNLFRVISLIWDMPRGGLHARRLPSPAWAEGDRSVARTLTMRPTCGITCPIRSYPSFPFATMSKSPQKVRKSRKDSSYNSEEMKVISKYKQEYRQQTTRELRGHVFKSKILVDLFNLWLAQGKAPNTEEDSATRMKVA